MTSLSSLFSSAIVASALLVTGARAQTFLDGRVVDSNGVGVPGVDVDIKNNGGGGTPNVLNDGTDANGFFHMTIQQTQATGNYTVTFNPPQPPASTALITAFAGIVVPLNTTVNMGTRALTPGVSISGHVQNTSGVAVAGLNFDVLDASGANVDLLYDQTDATGNFAFSSVAGPITLRLIGTTVVGQTVASQEMPLVLSGDTALGTIVMQPGFTVSAIVRTPAAAPIANCDVDVVDPATNVKLFTPNDNTNASGLVTVVVPAGTFDVEFYPPVATHLAPTKVNRTIAANTSLGVVTCPQGFFVSGTVRNLASQPVAGAHVTMRDALTNASIPLFGNDTSAAGTYSMLVAAGTYTMKFHAPVGSPYGEAIAYGVAVSADRALDATLPVGFVSGCSGDGTTATACPCGNTGGAGRGCANSANPSGALLVADGSTSVDPATGTDTVVLHVSGAPNIASVAAIFLQGDVIVPGGSVFGDGVLCLAGTLVRVGSKPLPGGVAQFPEPGNLSLSQRGGVAPGGGAVRGYQAYYRNSAAAFCPPATFNASNSVRVTW